MSVVHAPAEPTHALGGTHGTSGHPEPRGTGDTSLWRVALAPVRHRLGSPRRSAIWELGASAAGELRR